METVEQELASRGVEILGPCTGLAQYSETLLQESALLDNFTQAEAEALGSVMTRVRAQPGQVLIREGTTGDWMLLLLKGTVDVTKLSARGTPSRLAVIRSGASVGEMSMLDSAPRYATCSAIEEVEAGVLTRDAIQRLIHEHPAIGAKLLVKLTQILAQRLRNTGNQLVRVRAGTAADASAAIKARLRRRATDW